MTKLHIGATDLSEYIWNDTNVHDVTLLTIDRAVIALGRDVRLTFGGPGDTSGIAWHFIVKRDGSKADHSSEEFVVGEDERWKVALSYRGPFITALSWPSLSQRADQVTSPALVCMVKKLAEHLCLTYLDAHELMALEIPWDELQGNAANRLDYSEMPNAFNLLFYEY